MPNVGKFVSQDAFETLIYSLHLSQIGTIPTDSICLLSVSARVLSRWVSVKTTTTFCVSCWPRNVAIRTGSLSGKDWSGNSKNCWLLHKDS